MADEVDMHRIAPAGWDDALQRDVRRVGGDLRADQPQAAGHTPDMRIYRERRHAEREEEHARRRLRPDARQRAQVGVGLLHRQRRQEIKGQRRAV
jgi:hypothetical protein